MKAIDDYREKIDMLKKQNLLTDGVKLMLVGMFIADSGLTSDESKQLQREIDFDFEKYMGIEEAAIFGDIVDYKNQRVDYTKEELMKKK
ncbi:MAG: hypothetical protein NZM09_10150 [Ignavibacterium sp.]|nr:hypothetical protein [Ignavibacterium sp.]MDW8376040.1 hypothetical protein [Ignavibacteriales bacterium]